jgi:hypothetical protein
MRPCTKCRAPIENSFVLCPHCRAPQSDIWQKANPVPKPEGPAPRRRLPSLFAFSGDDLIHFVAIFVMPIVLGAVIGYYLNGTSGAVVGMFVAFITLIVIAILWAGGSAGG